MYKVVYADCPWKFNDNLPGETRGASRQYPCMTTADLCDMPLPPTADDAVLFFWRVASMQRAALDVIHAWGFNEPTTELVWIKKTVLGNRWFGMGHILRAEHEVCLIAKRGKPVCKNHSLRTTVDAQVGRHSEKPDVVYEIIEQLYDGPYVELFARRRRHGWASIGNQLPTHTGAIA